MSQPIRSDFATELGKRIATVRKERKLSQDQLSEMAGCSRDTLSRYERGGICPSAEQLGNIAISLRVSADHLMFGRHYQEDIETDIRAIAYHVNRLSSFVLGNEA